MKNLSLIFYPLLCLYFVYCIFTPFSFHFIDNVNLIFHEAGHTIFFFLPDLLTSLMGSLFQILIPFILFLYFIKRNDKMASYLILCWFGQSIINVSTYMRDAIKMQLELLGGDGVVHDWNYIFSNLGLLKYSEQIGIGFYVIGLSIILFAISNMIINLFPKIKQA